MTTEAPNVGICINRAAETAWRTRFGVPAAANALHLPQPQRSALNLLTPDKWGHDCMGGLAV
jgi:hypothetical protein